MNRSKFLKGLQVLLKERYVVVVVVYVNHFN